MSWFLLALISPALWAMTNFIDKYLVSKYFKEEGISILLAFSSLVGLFVLPIAYFINPDVFNISFINAFVLVISGIIYVFAVLPYLFVLKEEDTSLIVPLFQVMPIFSYFLALIFLKEVLTLNQIVASLIIVISAVGISLEFGKKKVKLKWRVFYLMMLSSSLYSVNFLLFKLFALKNDFWTVVFWEYIGIFVFFIALMCIKKYRLGFLKVFKNDGVFAVGINAVNEFLNIVAKIIFNFVAMLAPLALVWTINGFQPLFVLLFGVVLTLFFPKIIKEDISRKMFMQKLIFIALMFLGGYLLSK